MICIFNIIVFKGVNVKDLWLFPDSTFHRSATPSVPIWWTRWFRVWREPKWALQKKYVTRRSMTQAWHLRISFSWCFCWVKALPLLFFGCRRQRSICWTPKKMWRRSWRRLSVSQATLKTTASSLLSNSSSSLFEEVSSFTPFLSTVFQRI